MSHTKILLADRKFIAMEVLLTNRKFIAMEVLLAGTGLASDRFKIRNAMSALTAWFIVKYLQQTDFFGWFLLYSLSQNFILNSVLIG